MKARAVEAKEAEARAPATSASSSAAVAQAALPVPDAGGQLALPAADAQLALENGDQAAEAAAPDDHDFDSTPFDKNIVYISKLSQTRLESLLTYLEPVALSKANLKTVLKRGAKVQNMHELGNILEAGVGWNLETDIPVECRNMEALGRMAKTVNESLGRRMRDLQLPPNWERCGLYGMERSSEDVVSLWQNFGNTEKVKVKVPSNVELYLSANHSEHRAAIRQRGGVFRYTCALAFSTSDLVQEPTPKKRRVEKAPDAHSDGASTAGSDLVPPSTQSSRGGSLPASSASASGILCGSSASTGWQPPLPAAGAKKPLALEGPKAIANTTSGVIIEEVPEDEESQDDLAAELSKVLEVGDGVEGANAASAAKGVPAEEEKKEGMEAAAKQCQRQQADNEVAATDAMGKEPNKKEEEAKHGDDKGGKVVEPKHEGTKEEEAKQEEKK